MRQVLSRQVLGKGVLTAAAASSLLSIATGAAYALPGAMAEASHSPGVLAGNSVSVPVTFAPNVCGNTVDAGAGLNPAMGNHCATTTGSGARHDHAYDRYLSPEQADAFAQYLDERQARHEERHGARHEERHEQGGYGEAPRVPHQGGAPHQDGYGNSGEEGCDDHPAPERPEPRPQHPPKPHAEQPRPPAPHHAPPAPKPMPRPEPEAEHPAPEAPRPLPVPAPVEEAHTLPAPVPVAQEAPAPMPPRGSQFTEHPAPSVPQDVRPADQPPAPPAGDLPVHLPPVPAPPPAPVPAPSAPVAVPAASPAAPVAAPAQAPVGELAATGAGQPGAAAALAAALVLGGAILYRRSRIA
ncbi:chaplin [Streptomyces sp. NPDC006544]|uniref:chaplin n=1 Tax=Streptomyces sp. NPDC006544 TaxID=3154583 RepID=UPI0033AEE5F1